MKKEVKNLEAPVPDLLKYMPAAYYVSIFKEYAESIH
jgi:hypothetical protein